MASGRIRCALALAGTLALSVPALAETSLTGFVSAQSWFIDLTLVGMEKQ